MKLNIIINKIMNKTFEDFLKEKHAEQYTGLDDNMPNDYIDWVCKLDYGDMIKYVDEYVNQLTQELIKDCKKIEDILTQPLTK